MAKQDAKSYQETRQELDDLMVWFESDDVDLDQALEKYEQGMELIQQLQKQLVQAENKVTKLKQKFSE